MKSACILLKSKNEYFSKQNALCVSVFEKQGYAFDEIRIVSDIAEKDFISFTQELTRSYTHLVIFANKTQIQTVDKLLSRIISRTASFGNNQEVVIYSKEDKNVFLFRIGEKDDNLETIVQTYASYVKQNDTRSFEKSTFRCVGLNHQLIQPLIAKAKTIDGGKMRYFYQQDYSESIIDIYYDEDISKKIINDVMRLFADTLGESVYAVDSTNLAEQLVHILKLRGKRISVAESFTGGGIAKAISSVSGASEVYFEGLNTYNELSKIKRLGVSEYTLNTQGAVAEQTVYEMANGLLHTGNCDIAIATTGLAGPKSDRSNFPVGLCYIGIGTKEKVLVYRYQFDGSREEITQTAIQYALFLAYKELKNM